MRWGRRWTSVSIWRGRLGATLQQLDVVRQQIEQEAPVTLGGALVQNAGIRLCLATEAASSPA